MRGGIHRFDLHSLHFAFTRRSASSRYLCSSRGLEWPVAFKALSSLTSFVSSLHCLSCPSVQCGFTFLSPLVSATSPQLALGAAFPRGLLECPLAALLRTRHCVLGRSTDGRLPGRSGFSELGRIAVAKARARSGPLVPFSTTSFPAEPSSGSQQVHLTSS